MLPLSLLLLLVSALPTPSLGGSTQQGHPCNPLNTHLNPSNHQLTGDCDSTAYCSSNLTGYDNLPSGTVGVCRAKGCRRDEYPFGYDNSNFIPHLCPSGFFCPDEEDACLPLVPPGSPCQLNRDDQCSPPPSPLSSQLSSARNVNGSICLNFVCMWANVSLGEACEVENVVYTGYYPEGGVFYDVVSRDNCEVGGWCDGVSRVCKPTVAVGGSCGADKECDSYNCLSSGTCAPPPDTPSHVPGWTWAVLALSIIILAFLTVAALYIYHRRQRAREERRRREYWAEQGQYREVLSRVRGSLPAGSVLAVPGVGVGRYRDDPGTPATPGSWGGKEKDSLEVRPGFGYPVGAGGSGVGSGILLPVLGNEGGGGGRRSMAAPPSRTVGAPGRGGPPTVVGRAGSDVGQRRRRSVE